MIIRRSQLTRYLRKLAAEHKADGDEGWKSLVCEMAATDIELYEGIIMNDPVEIQMEEGGRANG